VVNVAPSEEFRYDRHWPDFDGPRARETWARLPLEAPALGDDGLDRRSLNDDMQQLFVAIVLEHAERLIDCARAGRQAEPLRLLLLGTARVRQTRAVKTLLAELRRRLAQAGLPAGVRPERVRARGGPDRLRGLQHPLPRDDDPPADPLVPPVLLLGVSRATRSSTACSGASSTCACWSWTRSAWSDAR
jgi:hypothetical protein